ncbi:MAG TPA: metal-dependent hydrolase [Caulobacteraceae bacterium]|nr:metal-dependent hydrolase [Caulobacteraceae bacterium]
MFVGHYSAALAAKAVEPRAPLWTLVAAAQLIDIGWAALVMGGIEKVRIDESLPGSALDLHYMPFTHSLPAVAVWSLAAIVLSRWLLKLSWRPAIVIGLVVFSHWLLDFLVHREDLLLWPGGDKVGLGWWNYPVPEQALEIGLLGLGGMALLWSRGRNGGGWFAPMSFFAGLVALQILVMFMPAGEDTFALGMNALIVYVVLSAVAWVIDRGPPAAAPAKRGMAKRRR